MHAYEYAPPIHAFSKAYGSEYECEKTRWDLGVQKYI